MKWVPTVWEREDTNHSNPSSIIQIHKMDSDSYEGERFAVRQGRTCLNKFFEWEYEPSPSNRDIEFYDRCRFKYFGEAADAVDKILKTRNE